MTKATIEDVAALAGFSIKTVSRVINREQHVRESTKAMVESAIVELDYRPNQYARSLAGQRAHVVGLIYDDPDLYEIPTGDYVTKLQQGALRGCRPANFELVIHPCNYRDQNIDGEIASLIDQIRPAGIIIPAPLSNMPKIVGAIEATGTAFVRLSTGETGTQDFSIATNDCEASAEMTCYLASLGHKRIAFITGHPTHKAVANRFLGYRDGLRKSGLEFTERLVASGDNSVGSGEECAKILLEGEDPPTAIFAANDDMAAGVLRLASQRHIEVPGQLSVAGCDDTKFAQLVHPALTTVRQPISAMAERAAQAIIDNGPNLSSTPGVEVFSSELRIRASTGPAPD
jgi:LacI family transcriptional regulator